MIEWMIDLPRKLQAPEVLKIASHPCSLKTLHRKKRQTSSLGCRRKQKPDDMPGDDGVGGTGGSLWSALETSAMRAVTDTTHVSLQP